MGISIEVAHPLISHDPAAFNADLLITLHIYIYIYRVFGWNRNCKPGIGSKKGSFRQNFSCNAYFCSVFVEKGVIMFTLCLYSHRDRKPRHTGPPQKGPFQDQFFTKNGHFWPPRTPIHPNTSLPVFGWNRNPLLSLLV